MIVIKRIIKHINILFLVNIFLFLCFIFLMNDEMILRENAIKVFEEKGFLKDINTIFSNNVLAVIPYIIPILGLGKFLLDIYITTFSINVFLIENEAIDLIKLFLPHFFIEFYAMTIWVYLSWLLFCTFFININNQNKHQYKYIFFLIILALTLLLVSAIIETIERGLFL